MNAIMHKKLLSLARAIRHGFTPDPGHSDLDDEQPINVSITLGDYRTACILLTLVEAPPISRRTRDAIDKYCNEAAAKRRE